MKISVYIATSLDGYIARKNGDIDWLLGIENTKANDDYGYSDFFTSVSCIVMGRNSFDKVLSFPEWPYGNKRLVVMTQTLTAVPEGAPGSVELFSGTPEALADKLKKEGEQKLYVDGGQIVQSFLRAGLIDEIILTRIPILIGEGLPLFGPVHEDIKLEHVETRTYDNGLVQSRYRCCHPLRSEKER